MAKYSADQLRQLAAKGHAMRNSDGEPSYPIADVADLQNAIHAVGRGGADHDAIRRYIIRRARDLGHSDMIPDNWASDGSLKAEASPMQTRASSIYIRESALVDVNKRQRLIDLVAVPWEQETDDPVPFAGMMLRERFLKGAFDGIESSAGRVSVNPDHTRTNPVGKVVKADPRYPEGLFTRAKIASTARGDEVLALADEDMLSPSVGYYTKSPTDYRVNRRAGTVEVHRAFLDHIALVGVPAYSGARVLEVRDPGYRDPALVAGVIERVDTPLLDEILADPVLLWAASRAQRG